MKKSAIIPFAFLLCAWTNLNAQYRYPNKEDQAKAKTLKSNFSEDDRICAVKSTENYSFETANADKNEAPLVIAHLEKENEIIALTDNYSTEFAEFYDSFSNIFRFKVWYKSDKSYKASDSYGDSFIADYAYNRNGFFCDEIGRAHV